MANRSSIAASGSLNIKGNVQDTEIRLGLIGFGALAERYYTPALRRLPSVSLTVIADPHASRRSIAAALFPLARTYVDYRDMLAREEVDGILVAAPPTSHLSIWNDASRMGLPVFMEKPFLLRGELARAENSIQARRLLMINFNRRFWPVYQRMGALARGGSIGELKSAEMIFQVDPIKWRAATPYRLSSNEGGVLYDLGSHAIDLIPNILREKPARVMAKTWSRRWESDQIELNLELNSGFMFRCSLAYQSPAQERIVIHGSEGGLCMDDPNMNLYLINKGATGRGLAGRCHDILTIGYRALRRDHSMLRYSIHASLGAFFGALRIRGAFSPGFDDAANNVIWLEAASKSAACGGSVELGVFEG